ncbi:MAG: hypothetical protein AAF602_20080 [Myxococcota bacterium]
MQATASRPAAPRSTPAPAPLRPAPPVARPSRGRAAVDQDEEPTIGPSSLTLETLREQLSFDDVVRRGDRPMDEDERVLFEESDTNHEREDAPTERGTVSQGAAGSFEVESRPVSATLRTQEKADGPVLRPRTIRGERSTLVPPDQESWVNEADAAESDEPDTWNPRADVEPGVDWGSRPAWSGETEPGQPTDPQTLIAHRSPELDRALNPGDFSNYVDEDEVDTREHAAALWEQRVQEEDADDPATAWRPSVSNKEGIRVFDDPTFDAGVDVGFDDGEVGDDSTVDLLTGAVQIPEDLLDDDSVDVTPDLPPLSARDFGTPHPSSDRTLEAPSPLPELPPREAGRPPAPSLPSFPSELETPPAAVQEPRGTIVPEPIDQPHPAFGPPPGVFAPEPTASLGPAPGAPLQRAPSGLSRDDILRGGIVSDDLYDEEPTSRMSWRVVFAVVAVAGFVGAIGIVGALVYIAQQPAVADFARGLFSGDDVEDAPLVDVAGPEGGLEADPEVVEVEPEVVEEPEIDPIEELAAIQAEAEVRTEVDPRETFAAVRALEPAPVPVPVPAPEPTPTPAPEPPPLIPSRIDEGDVRAIEPAPEPPETNRRKRRREREPEPAKDPARVAFEPPPAPPPSTEPPPGSKIAPADMDRWSRSAFDGQLTGGPAQRLAEVEIDDPQFTRARTLLYLNAKKRGQIEERRGHLGLLMTKPENKYSPVLLVEHAQDAMEQKQYGEALERAKVAEQHWARMPPALVFTRKALIYEIEALAHTGLFYESEGRDVNELRGAIRGWERFQRHVSTKGRDDMAARAEQQLERLRQLEERLQ